MRLKGILLSIALGVACAVVALPQSLPAEATHVTPVKKGKWKPYGELADDWNQIWDKLNDNDVSLDTAIYNIYQRVTTLETSGLSGTYVGLADSTSATLGSYATYYDMSTLIPDYAAHTGKVLSNTGAALEWIVVAGGGDVLKVGTPVNNQLGIWTGDGSIEGDGDITFDGADLTMTGDLIITGTVDGIDIATDVAANTLKVTNATHTGDVTGSGALTIAPGAVDVAMMSASGTPDATTFYRGDNSWTVMTGFVSLGDSAITGAGSYMSYYDFNVHASSTANPHTVTQTQVGLSNVENTALSTWVGTTNITTLGTIGAGVWNGSEIADAYVANNITASNYALVLSQVSYSTCNHSTTTDINIGVTSAVALELNYIAERNTGAVVEKEMGSVKVLYDDTSNSIVATSVESYGPDIGISFTADISGSDIRLNVVVDNSVANNVSFDWNLVHKFYE